MKSEWTVRNFMTSLPFTIGAEQPLKKAIELMQEHQIRHLPVLQAKQLVGVLTERDIAVARTFQGSAELRVEGVMMPMSYAVSPDTPLEEVTLQMAQHKYGSAIVIEKNSVIGIFTAQDALRALSEILVDTHRIAV
ncbi:CBS domain-containing protein [bacterium]|nr:CBS domain-containing protein [bacterium]NBX81675.1 CBS domain-containing protein [bacterium]